MRCDLMYLQEFARPYHRAESARRLFKPGFEFEFKHKARNMFIRLESALQDSLCLAYSLVFQKMTDRNVSYR